MPKLRPDVLESWKDSIAHMIQVPLLDLKLQYSSIREEVRAALDRVSDSQRFILGPEVIALEGAIASMCGVRNAIGVAPQTDLNRDCCQ